MKRVFKRGLTSVLIAGLFLTGCMAFVSCGSLELRYELNKDGRSYSVKGTHPFNMLSKTKKITIPSSHMGKPVTGICDWGFQSYRELNEIRIPDSVTDIGVGAFSDCQSLVKITLPDHLENFGGRVFMSCDNLKELIVSENCAEFTTEDGVLYNKDQTLLVQYPTGKESESFILPEGVVNVERYAFLGAKNVKGLVLPDSVKTLGYGAFEGVGAESLDLGKGLTTIEGSAMSFCSNLKVAEIPESVTSIGEGAFSKCTSMKEFNVAKDNPSYCSIDGNLYDKEGKRLIQYAIGKTETSFVLPDGVEEIGKNAFYSAKNLTDVTLSDGVKTIGETAFIGCRGLKNIDLCKVVFIGEGVFYYCVSLQSVTIPAEAEKIGPLLFHNCKNISEVFFENPEGWQATPVIIHAGVSIENAREPIKSEALSDPATACKYMSDTYCQYIWERTDQ